jgi:magnesium-transporting ATPase (P-type)
MPEAIQVSVGDKGAAAAWPTLAELAAFMPVDSSPQACDDARQKFIAQYGGSEELAKRLGSDAHAGLGDTEEQIQKRIDAYGGNWFEERALRSYMSFLIEALKDQVIILLLVMATVLLLVEGFFGQHRRRLAEEEMECVVFPGPLCSTWWMESVAIYLSCTIITNFVAASDWRKERMFAELQKSLETSNKKTIVRKGQNLEVTDRDIVVGDVVLFNAHNMSVLPTDGVVLATKDVKVDESALTGSLTRYRKTRWSIRSSSPAQFALLGPDECL